MLIAKRAMVWGLETAACGLLVAFALCFLWGDSQSEMTKSFVDRWVFLLTATFAVFMVGSGYLVTTAAAGISTLREKALWIYPLIISCLFIAHVQFFASGWSHQTKIPVQILGSAISFGCGLLGNYFMRRWTTKAGT